MAEPPKPPALTDLAQPSGPVFLRKMNKKSDWGSDETPPDERVSDIINLVFNRNTAPFSVYLVGTDDELHRVIIGMNGGRESLMAESHFIAIRDEELEAAGIVVDHTPGAGMTRCRFTNALHYDLTAEDDLFKSLCRCRGDKDYASTREAGLDRRKCVRRRATKRRYRERPRCFASMGRSP